MKSKRRKLAPRTLQILSLVSAFVAGATVAYLLASHKAALNASPRNQPQQGVTASDDSDPAIDEAIGLSAAANDLGESNISQRDEVNEFAQDQDEDVVSSTPVAAHSPLLKYAEKNDIDLTYINSIVSDMTSLRSNFVESEPIKTSLEWDFDRAAVLADSQDRIGHDFKIPELLRDRVGFWFDVYTKWDDNHRIIHNSRFPWIVYKVIDVGPIVSSEQPKHLWMRREKADKLVKQEVEQIRKALRSLAQKGKPISDTEKTVADALAPLGGDLRKQAARSVSELRIQTGQRNFFQSGLTISPRYLTTMEKIFLKYKLPVELTRIPFVESSFNKQATSKVGACGIWQFMGNTGRKFMLVNQVIDERRSPFKATEAAARLLKENHLILRHSWPLAVTAWNHGPGGVRVAARASGSNDLGVIVKKYRSRSFDFASSNFYSEFLAALHAERYSEVVFPPMERVAPVELQVVKLQRAIRVKELLKVSGLTLQEFLLMNPDLESVANKNLPIPVGFRVHVPSESRTSMEKLFAADTTYGSKRDS